MSCRCGDGGCALPDPAPRSSVIIGEFDTKVGAMDMHAVVYADASRVREARVQAEGRIAARRIAAAATSWVAPIVERLNDFLTRTPRKIQRG